MNPKLDIVPHLDDLWRYARVLTRNDADADDLVQEALTRALALGRSYDPARPLRAWLAAIVRNTFLTAAGKARAELGRIEAIGHLSDGVGEAAQEYSADLAKVVDAVGALPPEQAETLHLVGVLGLSYREAAEVTGVPIGTVMSRLNRARAALRARLGEEAKPKLKIVGGRDGSS